jgi:hypothetical protein
MNRSVVYLGIGVIVIGLALASFPLAVFGREWLDLEQEAGFLVAPVGLLVVMFGASFYDPTRTTVGGTFGNPDEPPPQIPELQSAFASPAGLFNPYESAACRFCRTNIPVELANCPRCARARTCRACLRPLGLVLERATCPLCARPEALCNCPPLAPAPAGPAPRARARGW